MAAYQQFSSTGTGTIMQKIEELREWQRQQQQKLLQQQEEQRVLLSNEQQRIFKEFGLPDRVLDTLDRGTSHVRSWLDSSSERSLDETQDSLSAYDTNDNSKPMCNVEDFPATRNFYKDRSSVCENKEEISPIKSVLIGGGRNLNLDDTPVNTAKKNFHELLQEKLEQLGGGDNTENNNNNAPKINNSKPKRPFLKKGEGIARFRMKPGPIKQKQKLSTVENIKKSTSTANNKVIQTRKNNKNVKSKQSKGNATTHSVKSSGISKSYYPKTPVSKLTLKRDVSSPKVATWAHVLQQQNQTCKGAQVQNTVISQQEVDSQCARKDSIELSFLEKVREAEKKNKKEVEELKIFEILEQHAANSSFCSTSSLVARLMEGSTNSTPVKNYQNVNQVRSFKKSEFSQELVSNNTGFTNKNSIVGYLPFGLDTEEGDESVQKAGAYVNNIELAVENNCNDGNKPLSDRNLHVRFSETNDYKSVSDASFSSQDDSTRNNDYNPRLEQSKNRMYFQDDQAWSDCSCTSSTSPNTSLNTSNMSTICQSPEPRLPPNQQYDVYSIMTRPNNRNPVSLDKESYCILNSFVTDSSKVEKTRVDVGVNTQNNGAMDLVQKNSLLKSRLDELEAEIEIFRRENTKLHKLKKEHEEEVAKYRKEKKEFEKNMKAEKEKMESAVLEEKKKLHKEKLVFERYCKDLKDQPTKQEREEIQALKHQLNKLQEELHKKDSRWNAANARTKDRMKVLEQENAQLKKEVDKLKKEKSQTLVKPRARGPSATRVIHTINDHIAKIKPKDLEDSIVVHDVVPSKKIPSSVLQQQKIPSHNHTKSKQLISGKVGEWGTTQSKTFQTIPDLKPQQTEVDVLQVPEEMRHQSIVTNHRSRHSSGHSNKSNEIISLHPPSVTVSYTSPEDDDDGDGDDACSKKSDARSYDAQMNDRINNLTLYNALYYATQLENNTGAPGNCFITNFTKAESSRISSSNGGNSSHSIGNTESGTSINGNCDPINFNEIENSEVRIPSNENIPDNIGIKNQPSSAVVSLNSDVINFIKSISSDAQISSYGLIPKGRKASSPSSSAASQYSDLVTFTTANSTRTHTTSNDNMPSTNKNSEEYVPTHDEIFIRDTHNQALPHNISSVRNYALDSVNTSQNSSSISMENRPASGTGDSSQYSSHSPSLTSQNGNSSTVSKLGNREKLYSDGRKEIWYPNGNLKKISADGSITKVIYYNGDVKETLKDGTVKYFYSETKTWHTTYMDGSEILEFPDGQMETRQKDGTKEVTYPNATVRTCFPDGREEWVFQDGLMVKVDTKLGEKVLLLPNGQREVHTRENMRREYPDGTVKILYPDGIQETRYSNGRIRVKDKDGKLVMDSIMQRL